MTWEIFCNVLKDSISSSLDELRYQKLIKNLLFVATLEWDYNQVSEQEKIQLGSSERLIPDIILSKDGNRVVIVEMKRPSHTRCKTDIQQLSSYMKQLEIPVGIYIGEHIEVFLKKFGDGNDPINILTVKFESNDKYGSRFIELFKESNYSYDEIERYWLDILKEREKTEKVKNTIEQLMSIDGQNLLKKVIGEYYLKYGLTQECINQVLESIDIKISSKRIETISPKNLSDSIYKDNNCDWKQQIDTNNKVIVCDGEVQDFALSIINRIIDIENKPCYQEVWKVFKDGMNCGTIVKPKKEIKSEDEKRWFLEDENLRRDNNGVVYAISKEWGKNNASKPKLKKLLKLASERGINYKDPWI